MPEQIIKGWIFDAYASPEGVVVWVVGETGEKRRLVDRFSATFYIRELDSRREFWKALPRGIQARLVRKREFYSGEEVDVWEVPVFPPAAAARIAKALEPFQGSIELYNGDIPVAQQYFYSRGVFPLAWCAFHVEDDSRLVGVTLDDSPWDLIYRKPPLRLMKLRMEGEAINPLHRRAARLEVETDGLTQALEAETLLESLEGILARFDPDIVMTEWGDAVLLPKLIELAARCGRPLSLNRDRGEAVSTRKARSFVTYGRIAHQSTWNILKGRWHLDWGNSFMLPESRLDGVLELSRLSQIPVQQMARTTTGTAITSMEMSLAFKKNILIPWRKREAEEFKSLDRLIAADKGGLTYAPLVGVHDNVAEIDFASMYPTIIAQFNISPETVNCRCCAPSPICARRRGLVPETLEPILRKRAEYKKLRDAAPTEEERRLYQDRQNALKWVLVVCFGYLGYKNARFGKIEAHEATTAHAREKLLEAKEIAERGGYRMLHAIVDSMWVHREGATEEEYRELTRRISEGTGLPAYLEHVYRWIAFYPARRATRAVHNKFLGVARDGKVKVRGLEVRRESEAPIVRRMQEEMIARLAEEAADARGYAAAMGDLEEIFRAYAERVESGRVAIEDLIINRNLSRDPGDYKVRGASAVAAGQLRSRGVKLMAGETIQFIYTDAECRVQAYAVAEEHRRYDTAKYVELLRRAWRSLADVESWIGGAPRSIKAGKR